MNSGDNFDVLRGKKGLYYGRAEEGEGGEVTAVQTIHGQLAGTNARAPAAHGKGSERRHPSTTDQALQTRHYNPSTTVQSLLTKHYGPSTTVT